MSNRPRSACVVGCLVAACLLAIAGPAPAEPTPGSKVVVNVGKMRNKKGTLGCRLYRSAAGFPESTAGTIEKHAAIVGEVVTLAFDSVAPGTYAISCMHDENDNHKLDKSFLGIPTEGYGVSNNHTHALSTPTWDESKFVVEADRGVGLAIALRY